MKENELRINNYVLIHGNIEKVTGISNAGHINYEDSGFANLDKGYVEPIPLTKEWLIKFGFEKDEESVRWMKEYNFTDYSFVLKGSTPISKYFRVYHETDKNKQKGIDIRGVEMGEFSVYANQWWTQSVKYIHQLQNLYFALTGEELILKA